MFRKHRGQQAQVVYAGAFSPSDRGLNPGRDSREAVGSCHRRGAPASAPCHCTLKPLRLSSAP
eukprot:scaffold628731_cov46-Prasinocladus_malaysianus.AAC.1